MTSPLSSSSSAVHGELSSHSEQSRPVAKKKRIFISLRFGEAHEAAKELKQALHEACHDVDVFLCDVPPGDDISEEIITALTDCDLAVIMGTKTYGKKTASKFSTFEELRFIINEEKPYFLIKMCDEFQVKQTRFRLPADISYFLWNPDCGTPAHGTATTPRRLAPPAELVPQILKKLGAVTGAGDAGTAVSPRRAPPRLDAELTPWLDKYRLLGTVGYVLERLGITNLKALEQATQALRNTRQRAVLRRDAEAAAGKRKHKHKHKQRGKGARAASHAMATASNGGRQGEPASTQLIEDMLRREKYDANNKLPPAVVARFLRACRARTWRGITKRAQKAGKAGKAARAKAAGAEGEEGGGEGDGDTDGGNVGVYGVDSTAEDGVLREDDAAALAMVDGDEQQGDPANGEHSDSPKAVHEHVASKPAGVADERVFLECFERIKDEAACKQIILSIWNNTSDEEEAFVDDFTLDMARALGEALKGNTTVKDLDLSTIEIDGEQARAIAAALPFNTTLETLNMEGNEIGPDAAVAIADALKRNTSIVELDLEDNGIGPRGLKAISEALQENTTLQILLLGENDLLGVPEDAESDSEADISGVKALADALRVNRTLLCLSLRDNVMTSEAWRLICNTLAINQGLAEIDLSEIEITDTEARQLLRALRVNRRIIELDVDMDEVSDGLDDRIMTVVERNEERQEALGSLLKLGSVPLSTAKVFVCGHQGIGKTTLINTLQASPSFFATLFRRRRKVLDEPDHPEQRTPGIEMHDFALRRKRSSASVVLTASTSSCAPDDPNASADWLHAGTDSDRDNDSDEDEGDDDDENGGGSRASTSSKSAPRCKLRVYDFAGQTEYHVVHELLFADHNAVFVVCVDLSKDKATVEESVLYWLRFIKTRLAQAVHRSQHPPHVFVVGTKADKVHEQNALASTPAATATNSAVSPPPQLFPAGDGLLHSSRLREWFGDAMRVHPFLVPLRCHDARDAGTQHLRDLLHAAWVEVTQQEVRVPKVVELIARGIRVCRRQDEGPWPVAKLFAAIKERVADLRETLEFDESVLRKTLRYLHVRGDVLWFHAVPSLADQIFVSPPWLLRQVVGPSLAPERFPQHLHTTNGRVTFSEFESKLGRIMPADTVVDVLASMLLCFEEDQAVHNSSERHFVLPSRLQWDPDRLWNPADASMDVYAGRGLVVPRESGMVFPPGVFPRIQSRMVHCFGAGTSVWQNGFITLFAPVELYGRIIGDERIDLWVRCPSKFKEDAWLALDMMLAEVEEEVQGIDYDHLVLSYVHLSCLHPFPAGYALADVEDAALAGETHISTMLPNTSPAHTTSPGTLTDELDNLLREDLFLKPLALVQ
ncbi:hypothetical protein PTSG_12838 [Salpingoeca rosetta]|uniref:C-terminal of Roc (COR) domain-containing protein n=1 Tax=Salpingoeca rosetta (strain ATCC 50818 / BSB-021) TaxID=946362 RepID=F2UM66_SALR5|nr:uncharacterized protein PTSG_12838 [Salpingoeca rosetta]EGD78215.1 hypothetical protein PTSG_12838 [Salpingoeca rosetta]|eukprot:XP_004989891.1 hypothetical protein PTSG_12838 [Salpingoeca rosetta]